MHITKKVILGENYKNTIDALLIHTQRSNVVETKVELVSIFLIPIGYGYLMVFLYSIPFGSIYHA
jgi:hypothetical protein